MRLARKRNRRRHYQEGKRVTKSRSEAVMQGKFDPIFHTLLCQNGSRLNPKPVFSWRLPSLQNYPFSTPILLLLLPEFYFLCSELAKQTTIFGSRGESPR